MVVRYRVNSTREGYSNAAAARSLRLVVAVTHIVSCSWKIIVGGNSSVTRRHTRLHHAARRLRMPRAKATTYASSTVTRVKMNETLQCLVIRSSDARDYSERGELDGHNANRVARR